MPAIQVPQLQELLAAALANQQTALDAAVAQQIEDALAADAAADAAAFQAKDDEIAALTQSVEEKTIALETAQEALTTAQTNLTTVQNDLASANGTIADLETQLTVKTNELATAQQTISARDATIASLNATIADINTTINELNSQIAALSATVQALQARIDELENPPPELGLDDVVWGFSVDVEDADEGETVTYTFSALLDGQLYTLKPGESAWFEFEQTGAQVEDFIANQSADAITGVAAAGAGFSFAVHGTSGNRRVTISDEKALSFSFSRTITEDEVTEGPETVNMALLDVSAGTIGVALRSWVINDTSVTPDPEEPPPGGFWQGLATVWPTAATTGPRLPLTNYTGSYNLNSAQTIIGKRFTGQLNVTAHDVVLQDCEINCTGSWGIDADLRRIKLINCRLIGVSGGREAAVLGIMDIEACEIYGFKDGLKPQGANYRIFGNYIHSLYAGPGAHNDGIQCQGDGPGIIERNFIDARDTSAIMLQPQYPLSGVTIRHNWLGGADLPLRIESGCVNCGAYENVIERGYWGYGDLTGSNSTLSYGNIDHITGAVIPNNQFGI